MRPISEKQLRACFVNASLRERNTIVVPDGFDELKWDELDYLGWGDRKSPQLAYVVVDTDDGPVGVMMRRADSTLRARPQCAWCEDVHLPNDVIFFSVKRAGPAGRNGDTVGTLVCAQFECSANVRRRPPTAYVGFDVEAARQHRIQVLRENVRNFVGAVTRSS